MSISHTVAFVWGHPLNRGGKLRALGRLLHWQIATRLSGGAVRFPFVDEMVFMAEPGMTGASGNFYCGLHEPNDMAFVLHFLRPGDVFYDVGANVGSYTLLAAAAGARVHAFEPSPATAAKLRRNIQVNSLEMRIVLHECALGAVTGTVQLSRGTDTTNHVLADGESKAVSDTVAMETLDDSFEPDCISFLKMDVEGFESEVLKGARGALANPGLRGVLMENNGRDKRYGASSDGVALLAFNGFSSYRYDPSARILDPAPPGRGGNVLYLRDASEAQARVASGKRFKLSNGWI
jgi:FkbM family methyltransferase